MLDMVSDVNFHHQLRQERLRVRTDMGEEAIENLDGKGWTRVEIPALTRELAAETRALRMLHLPDTRTPTQKRKDMEARAAGGGSSSAAGGGYVGAVAGSAVGATYSGHNGPVVSSSTGVQGSAGNPGLIASQSAVVVGGGKGRRTKFAEGGPGTLSPK